MFNSTYKKTFLTKTLLLLIGIVITFLFTVETCEASDSLVNWNSLCVYGDESLAGTKISPQEINEEKYLVLPSNLSPNAVNLQLETKDSAAVMIQGAKNSVQLDQNSAIDLIALCGEADSFDISIVVSEGDDTE